MSICLEELQVLKHLFERKAMIDAQYGIEPATTPKPEPTSCGGIAG
jgi:hypothetical protein